MTDEGAESRPRFPYMSPGQLSGVRARLKQTVPTTVTIDWIMGALDSTEKTARNVLPQLRLLGLTDSANKPTDLVYDFKDDETFAKACAAMIDFAYPETLRQAYDDPGADPSRIGGWFSRNAKTGEAAAGYQARLYLFLLKAEVPSADDRPARRRAGSGSSSSAKPAKKPDVVSAQADVAKPPVVGRESADGMHPAQPQNSGGPDLHIDLQIHIAADADNAQIDAIFASMAKHLYGR